MWKYLVLLAVTVDYGSSDTNDIYHQLGRHAAYYCRHAQHKRDIDSCNTCECESSDTISCSVMNCPQSQENTTQPQNNEDHLLDSLTDTLKDCKPNATLVVDDCLSCRCLTPGVMNCTLAEPDCLLWGQFLMTASKDYLYGDGGEDLNLILNDF